MAEDNKINNTPPIPGASTQPTGTPEELAAAALRIAAQLGETDGMVNDACVERKSITVVAVPRRSAYRAINDRVLEPRVERIGSSITAKKALMQNSYLLVKYFPPLVGESYNSPNFTKAVASWLENISVAITNTKEGKTFDISFRYDTPELKKEYVEKVEHLEKAYEKADKSKIQLRKVALATYIKELMTIEYKKAEHGIPMNLEHYIVWLHCLHYQDVAKDPAFISMSSTVRMFFKDETKERAQKDAKQAAKKKAMANYLTIVNDKAAYEEMLVLICKEKDLQYRSMLEKGDTDVDVFISDVATKEPELFNSLFNDNYRKIRAMISRGIASGFLKCSDINQKITTAENKDIGNNMTEAIAFYSDPVNITHRKQLETRLKLS